MFWVLGKHVAILDACSITLAWFIFEPRKKIYKRTRQLVILILFFFKKKKKTNTNSFGWLFYRQFSSYSPFTIFFIVILYMSAKTHIRRDIIPSRHCILFLKLKSTWKLVMRMTLRSHQLKKEKKDHRRYEAGIEAMGTA